MRKSLLVLLFIIVAIASVFISFFIFWHNTRSHEWVFSVMDRYGLSVPYASGTIKDSSGNPLAEIFTDESGYWTTELPVGEYHLYVEDGVLYSQSILDGPPGDTPIQVILDSWLQPGSISIIQRLDHNGTVSSYLDADDAVFYAYLILNKPIRSNSGLMLLDGTPEETDAPVYLWVVGEDPLDTPPILDDQNRIHALESFSFDGTLLQKRGEVPKSLTAHPTNGRKGPYGIQTLQSIGDLSTTGRIQDGPDGIIDEWDLLFLLQRLGNTGDDWALADIGRKGSHVILPPEAPFSTNVDHPEFGPDGIVDQWDVQLLLQAYGATLPLINTPFPPEFERFLHFDGVYFVEWSIPFEEDIHREYLIYAAPHSEAQIPEEGLLLHQFGAEQTNAELTPPHPYLFLVAKAGDFFSQPVLLDLQERILRTESFDSHTFAFENATATGTPQPFVQENITDFGTNALAFQGGAVPGKFSFAIDIGPSTAIRFSKKVQPGTDLWNPPQLRFFVNDIEYGRWSSGDWQQVIRALPEGTHTFSWVLDGESDDRAWINEIQLVQGMNLGKPVMIEDPRLREVIVHHLGNRLFLPYLFSKEVQDLEYLMACGSDIRSLDGLAALENLHWVELHGNQIADLEALQDLEQIRYLDISANTIVNLAPLASLTNLESLSVWDNPISDLNPIRDLNHLKRLYFFETGVKDLTPLIDLPELSLVWLWRNSLDLSEDSKNLHVLQQLQEKKVDIQYLPQLVHSPTPLHQQEQVSLTPILRWSSSILSSNHTHWYEVYVGRAPEQLNLMVQSSENQLTLEDLQPGSDYYWQIRVFDYTGNLLEKSPLWSFSTRSRDMTIYSIHARSSNPKAGMIRREDEAWSDTIRLTRLGDSYLVLEANPASGFAFDGWYEQGVRISEDLLYTTLINRSVSLEARFVDAFQIQWSKTYGGSGDDSAFSVQQTTDGGYVVVGTSDSRDGVFSVNPGAYSYWVLKLDPDGLVEWQKPFGGQYFDFAYSVTQTVDHGFAIAGYTSSSTGHVTESLGWNDFWVVRTDSSGQLVWQRSFGGSRNDHARSIRQTRDGGFIVAGDTESRDHDITQHQGGVDFWVVKLNGSGVIEWQRTYGGTGDEAAYSVRPTKDGGYIVAGYTTSSDGHISANRGDADFWIIKLDERGAIEWERALGGSSDDRAFSIQQTNDGGFVAAGYSYSDDFDVSKNRGSADYWIVKLDPSGRLEWERSYGGSDRDIALSIQETHDLGFIVAGVSNSQDGDVSSNPGKHSYWILKLDSEGFLEWERAIGGSGYDFAYSIQQTDDLGFIVGGYSYSSDGDVPTNFGSADYWLVKFKFLN